MSCFHPRDMHELIDKTTGEVVVKYGKPGPYSEGQASFVLSRTFKVGCGQCSGCRSKYTRDWAIRCFGESLFHKENCFLTLTVSDDRIEEVFPGGSLTYVPFQKFIRSLRKCLGSKIRFFMCGEYGEKLSRPHYHCIIFGWYPAVDDRRIYKNTAVGPLYISNLISKLWPYGFHTVANFTRETASYTAGYMQKKINGKMAHDWYGDLSPEFASMSLKPGIGEEFYKKFKRDLYDAKDGFMFPGGTVVSVPRYYDKLHALYHPSHMYKVKLRRQEPDPVRELESTPARLAAREVIHKSKLRRSKRDAL